jgi:hypothetical protein
VRPATALLLVAFAALSACKGGGPPPVPQARETEVPQGLGPLEAPATAQGSGIGTPLKDRVATLGILNKRNNLTHDVKLKPGESRRWGDVIVRLASCERTAPWERPPETGAFVQVLVAERTHPEAKPTWKKIFSGWLFKNSPSLNVVEHPIYDVWVKDCAMSFPGETPAAAASSSNAANASGKSAATPAPQASASNSR